MGKYQVVECNDEAKKGDEAMEVGGVGGLRKASPGQGCLRCER